MLSQIQCVHVGGWMGIFEISTCCTCLLDFFRKWCNLYPLCHMLREGRLYGLVPVCSYVFASQYAVSLCILVMRRYYVLVWYLLLFSFSLHVLVLCPLACLQLVTRLAVRYPFLHVLVWCLYYRSHVEVWILHFVVVIEFGFSANSACTLQYVHMSVVPCCRVRTCQCATLLCPQL